MVKSHSEPVFFGHVLIALILVVLQRQRDDASLPLSFCVPLARVAWVAAAFAVVSVVIIAP